MGTRAGLERRGRNRVKNIDIALNLLVYCKPGKAAVMEQHEHHEHNQGSETLFDPEHEQLLHDQPAASMQRKDGEGAVPGDRCRREVKPGVCFCVQRSAHPLGGWPSVSLHRLAVITHDW